MQVKKTNTSDTSLTFTFVASEADLSPLKQKVVLRLGKSLKLAGFRPGKAPQSIIEKNLDQSVLQSEVIEEAINLFYVEALDEHRVRPVSRPEVAIKKFVPFTTLEFEATVDVVGDVTLADYKRIKKTPSKVTVTDKDVDEVLKTLQQRMADKKDVERAAKDGDQVTIDFSGVDDKGKPVNGAEGKDYPLLLGSDSFIPGFEKNLIGMKPVEEKTFELVFPKDYSVKALANKKVTFTVTANSIQEVAEPVLDDEFAKKAGPVEDLKQLKEEIHKQLTEERQYTTDREFEQSIIEEIAKKSKVAIPDALLQEQVEGMLREQRQNLMYRGQTFEEFLSGEGKTEEAYRKEVLLPQAAERVKAGLVLSEVADKEGLQVTPEELEIRIQLLRGQYQDPAMLAELDKPENRRDVAMRMLTEKTVSKLVEYATK